MFMLNVITSLDSLLSKSMINWSGMLIAIVKVLLVLIVGHYLLKVLLKTIATFLNKNESTRSINYIVSNGFKLLFYIVQFLLIVSLLGFETTSFLTLLGSLGIAIGLAIQGSLSNLASGILIAILKPFKIGDIVYLGAMKDERLVVKQIRFFMCAFTTIQDYTFLIPNTQILSSSILNLSRKKVIQFEITIGIAYEANIKKAREVAFDVFRKEEKIIQSMPFKLIVSKLADSEIVLKARAFVHPKDHLAMTLKMNEEVKEAFDKHNVAIPFPQMDVYIKNKESLT